ncbi:MAG: glucosaminidase domain-containing protein [Methylocystaceae bacterium]
MQPIPTVSVNCVDGARDTYVGLNPNINTDEKIQAFVDCFITDAQYASSNCSGLPIRLILAQWGGESGWGTGKTQKDNQNWSNMLYTNINNPSGNSGRGTGSQGWARFSGRQKHAHGYAYFFHKEYNPRYSDLMEYLETCETKLIAPDEYVCARYIADAGYGGEPDQYYQDLVDYMETLNAHTGDFYQELF